MTPLQRLAEAQTGTTDPITLSLADARAIHSLIRSLRLREATFISRILALDAEAASLRAALAALQETSE